MEAIFKDKNNRPTTGCNTKPNRATSKCRQKTTVSRFNRCSLCFVVRPEKCSITENVMCTARVENRVIREATGSKSHGESRRGKRREHGIQMRKSRQHNGKL